MNAATLTAALALVTELRIQVCAYSLTELTVWIDGDEIEALRDARALVGAALDNFGMVGRFSRHNGRKIWHLEIGEAGCRKVQSRTMRTGFEIRMAA